MDTAAHLLRVKCVRSLFSGLAVTQTLKRMGINGISGKRCLRVIIMTVYHHRPERGHVCLSIFEAGTIHCSWENRPLSKM